MRIAGLFDIHGNLPALESVLSDVERAGVDLVVAGGDVASGPMPSETLDRLLELGSRVRFVRGNCERDLVDAYENWAAGLQPEAATTAPEEDMNTWAAPRLSVRHRELLATFPTSVTLAVEGLGDVMFCHATPRSDNEIITIATSDPLLEQALVGATASVIVAGHTHVQMDRSVNGKRFVNAGSVGMPYEDAPGAYWALLGPDVSLRRTSYDYTSAVALMRSTGYSDLEEMFQECLLAPIGSAAATGHFDAIAKTRQPPDTSR